MSQHTAQPFHASATHAEGVGAAKASTDGDSALVARVQAGEVEAFSTLVRTYRQRVYSVIYNLTHNREDAADLSQEAFLKAFTSIHKFKGTSAFYTWLYRIAVNTALAHLRKHKHQHFFSFNTLTEDASELALLENLPNFQQSSGLPASDKKAMLTELQEKINEAMQQLKPKHRTVLVLHEIEGLQHNEIATITGTSVGTVRSRLHYAKKQMQQHLSAYLK